MLTQRWTSRAAIFTTIGLLISLSLPAFASKKAFAQTSSNHSQCIGVKLELYIRRLKKGSPSAFNRLVACNSQAVPTLIKALNNQNENTKIITVAVLGEIGENGAPAIPHLTKLLKKKNQDINIIAAHTLGEIGEAAIPALIKALQDNKNWQVRYIAADALGQMGAKAKKTVPVLIKARETDPNWDVSNKAADAVNKIRIHRLYQALSRRNQKISTSDEHCQIISKKRFSEICKTRIFPTRTRLIEVEAQVTTVGQTIINARKKTPVMCKIPVLKAIFKWKCPSKGKK
ncbi:MAG: HEAT repeat domain-containing protein [Calothrix sp. MO_192.B10]|nr:HEAT repeat domain-containing protein [Calothrix sp. MO_192.B10]